MSDWQEIEEVALALDCLYQAKDQKRLGRIWSNSEFLAAVVTDWGELVELVMKRDGLRPGDVEQEDIEHELADIFWALLVLSDRLGIDLRAVFLREMKELTQRLEEE